MHVWKRLTVRRATVVLAALTLVFAACGRDKETTAQDNGATTTAKPSTATGALDNGAFGNLGVLCKSGNGGDASDTGVTKDAVQVGTFSDPGFVGRPGLNQELFDTAEAFTKWCNSHGGINGRKIVLKERDAKLTEFQQRVIEACDQHDFMDVGGGAAFDDTGQNDRLACGLPVIPGYAVSAQASGAHLSIQPLPNPANELSIGSLQFLEKRYPDTVNHVGILAANISATASTAARYKEAITKDMGWKVVYNGVYNALGETTWRTFLDAMRATGVRGLIYVGEPGNLAKFLTEAKSLGATFDWVSVDANAYDPTLTDGAGTAADGTYVRTSIHPFLTDQDARNNEATQQYRELMQRYDPGGKIAYLGVQGLSAWLLFAKAANECGANLTRDCVWEKATKISEWTGGGLHARADLTGGGHSPTCWGLVEVKNGKFRVAPIHPNDDVFVCNDKSVVPLTGNYGRGAKCPNPAYANNPKPSTCAR
jgi:ABC-type branched-subunit amino acid transport system substrate-binding protein